MALSNSAQGYTSLFIEETNSLHCSKKFFLFPTVSPSALWIVSRQFVIVDATAVKMLPRYKVVNFAYAMHRTVICIVADELTCVLLLG